MFKKIFEFKVKNIALILGMLIAFVLSIFKSYYLANFIDKIASNTMTGGQVVPSLGLLLGIILLTIIANVILIQYLPLKLTLDKSD